MMLEKKLIVILLLLSYVSFLDAQLTIIVNKIPNNTPENAPIYIAGTMNNWNPGDANFRLTKNSDLTYSIKFTPSIGQIKFKFTRGSWSTVEGNGQGGFITDRVASYDGSPKTISLSIEGWEGQNNLASTASPQVKILSDSFFIPQLNRYRRIWLYLPKNYLTSTGKYPVIYMHDGQNLFDRKTSFAGEWRVDEILDSLQNQGDGGCIVVGIENGGGQRINEYSPWVNPQYGGGQGDEYIHFIVNTLKPYVDQNYRTLSDSDHTAMIGSSMGGFISMYAGLTYPDVFGRIGAFSSAYWFSNEIYNLANDNDSNKNIYYYLITGKNEGGNQVTDLDKMYNTLINKGLNSDQLFKSIHPDGQHQEWYWSREFVKAYLWLFEKKISNVSQVDNFSHLKISNCGMQFNIQGLNDGLEYVFNLYSLEGKKLMHILLKEPTFDMFEKFNAISSQGLYLAQVIYKNKTISKLVNLSCP